MGRAKELMMKQQLIDDEKQFASYLLDEDKLSSKEAVVAKKFLDNGLNDLTKIEKNILENDILTKEVPRCPRCGEEIEKSELGAFQVDGYCSACSSNLDD